MNFIDSLTPTLGKCDSVWVTMDWLTKSMYFIPIRVNYNAEKLTKIYIRNIDRLNGVLIFFVSDRGMVFILGFWSIIKSDLGF